MKKIVIILLAAVFYSTGLCAQTNVLLSTGNAGIGTTSPSYPLHILSAPASGSAHAVFQSSSGSHTSYGGIVGLSSAGRAFYLTVADANFSTGYHAHAGDVTLAATTGAKLHFRAGATDAGGITINESGNIGIGTTNPSASDASATTFQVGNNMIMQNVVGNQVALTNNAFYNSTGWYVANSGAAAGLRMYSNGSIGFATVGSSSTGANINSTWTDKFSITNNGNIGIGTTAPSASDASARTLQIGDNMIMQNVIGNQVALTNNAFYNGTGWYVANTGAAAGLRMYGDGSVGIATVGSTSSGININSTWTDKFTIRNEGNIGVGTSSPIDRFEVAGGIHTTGTASASKASDAFFDYYGSGSRIGVLGTNTSTNGTFKIETYRSNASNPLTPFFIDEAGNIGMGTTNPGAAYKLSVNGNIRAKKLVVETGWSDYVFNDDYKLRTLSSLESFIKQNKHLPDVPTAKEVEEKGISVGDSQALLLKKIEEMTLYMIQMKKLVDKQSTEIQQLKKKRK